MVQAWNECLAMQIELSAWLTCKKELILKACASGCGFPSPPLDCHAEHYKLILLVLCCAFLVLLCTLIAACLILRMQQDRMQHLASTNASGNLLEKIKAGWAQALWWKP